MPFIPHTENDIDSMLQYLGISSIDQLFDEIPTELKNSSMNRNDLDSLQGLPNYFLSSLSSQNNPAE